ncbi:type IV secretion system protein [Dickeya dadantii]|uniref:type IV secretion system protein n=1 Tax=Dickeya dadantii TaxID=204038 RepID=UPI0014958C06|nr:type IV secretion system protein [Dickeya dadantii]NPE55591.1 hypothetical protein [Dickeya dadantii]
MAFTFFTDFERNVDNMVTNVVNTISSNAVEYFTPLIGTCFGMMLAWFAVNVMSGTSELPGMDFIKKMFHTTLVVGIAGAGGLYQREIMTVILAFPSELSTALIGASHSDANFFDSATEKTLDITKSILDLVGMSPESWLNVLVAAVFFVSCLFLIGTAAIYFMISKVVVGILASLGCIFILASLFESARNFFYGLGWSNIALLVNDGFSITVFFFLHRNVQQFYK